MKNIIIYGEFLEVSTTGIAYMNSMLEQALLEHGFKINKLYEPRTNDYLKEDFVNKRNLNLKSYLILFKKYLRCKKSQLSFITISDSYLGLIKTFLIMLLLKIKSNKIFIFSHRSDLLEKYNSSFLKKIFINIIFIFSTKIIFLSQGIKQKMQFNIFHKEKFKVLNNALAKKDMKISKKLFLVDNSIKKNDGIFKVIFSSNVQRSKGIYECIEAINILNQESNDRFKFDIYGMLFEKINFDHYEFINYKGKLNYFERLEKMSEYDLLVLPSLTEGFPMIMLECMAIGLPFITTNVGAIGEVLGNDYPYFCKNNLDSIKKNIQKVISDYRNNSIKEILKKNRDLIIQKYSYQNYFTNLIKIINKN